MSYDAYAALQAAPSQIISAAAAADSLVIGASPNLRRTLKVDNNPMLYARTAFSGSAADTVILYCNLWIKIAETWTYLGTHQDTVTAGAVVDANGDNVGQALSIFDTSCATYVELAVGLPSAGNVDVTAWLGAFSSRGR